MRPWLGRTGAHLPGRDVPAQLTRRSPPVELGVAVHEREAAVGRPAFGVAAHVLFFRLRGRSVAEESLREVLHDAEIARGEDVGAAEAALETDLGRPAADPAQPDEAGDRVLVRERRQDLLRELAAGERAGDLPDRDGLRARETETAQPRQRLARPAARAPETRRRSPSRSAPGGRRSGRARGGCRRRTGGLPAARGRRSRGPPTATARPRCGARETPGSARRGSDRRDASDRTRDTGVEAPSERWRTRPAASAAASDPARAPSRPTRRTARAALPSCSTESRTPFRPIGRSRRYTRPSNRSTTSGKRV